MRDLFLHELKDIYNAEQQLVSALPKMRDAAYSTDLKVSFDKHLDQTREHVNRIEQVFDILHETPSSQTCDGMKGLLKEGEHHLKAKTEGPLKDAGIVTAAQKTEHYEISAYQSLIAMAEELDYSDAVDILSETLKEEEETATMLSKMAENDINPQAAISLG